MAESHEMIDGALASLDEESAAAVSQACKDGDEYAIFKCCCKFVRGWEDASLVQVQILTGGMSGMPVRLVKAELGPAAEALGGCSDSVVVKYVEEETEGDWASPCTGNLGFAAHLNWSTLPGVPVLHYPRRAEIYENCAQIKGLSILECIPGGPMGDSPTPEHMCSEQDAAAFGRLVGDLHSADTEWHDTFAADGKRGSVGFLLKKFEKELAAGGPVAQEMVELAKTRGYEPLCCFQLCSKLLANLDKAGHSFLAEHKPMEAIVEATKLQDPASLMGRLVVGHGDLHQGQILRRQKGMLGDLAIIDYDRCSRMPAGTDFAPSLALSYPASIYPGLETRRVAAKAYVAALGADVVASHTRTSIDEILFDMEKAVVLRWCFLMPLSFDLLPPGISDETKAHFAICSTHLIHEAVDLLKQATDDVGLRSKLVEEGVVPMTKSWSVHMRNLFEPQEPAQESSKF